MTDAARVAYSIDLQVQINRGKRASMVVWTVEPSMTRLRDVGSNV